VGSGPGSDLCRRVLRATRIRRDRRRGLDLDGTHQVEEAVAAGYSGVGRHHDRDPPPPERQKRIDTWVDMKQQYAAVKERITKRLAEVEEQKRKDAK